MQLSKAAHHWLSSYAFWFHINVTIYTVSQVNKGNFGVYLGVKTCDFFLCFSPLWSCIPSWLYCFIPFVFFLLRHSWVWQVFTPRMSQKFNTNYICVLLLDGFSLDPGEHSCYEVPYCARRWKQTNIPKTKQTKKVVHMCGFTVWHSALLRRCLRFITTVKYWKDKHVMVKFRSCHSIGHREFRPQRIPWLTFDWELEGFHFALFIWNGIVQSSSVEI